MSAPVHRTSERPSATALAAARQRREEGRTGSSSGSGTSAEQAFLGLQSSAGNQAATASVQRARGRTLERTPGADTTRPGSEPGARRAPAGRARGGSAPSDLADRAPLDTGSGTRQPASVPEVRGTTSTPERVAPPEATTAARFTPSGRTRRGSESDTRPEPAAPTRRGSVSGAQGMEVDTRFQEELDAAREEARAAAEEARLAAERTAAEEARLAALAARFTPSGRTRRGSESDTRPDPAALTRRGSDSGTQGMEADAHFREELDAAREEARAAAERAAEEARLAALAARFTPSGRTRRGSDLDTRPDPAALTRRGSDSGTQGMEVDPRFQEHVDTARDEARRAAEEEARLAEARAAAEEARRAAERAAAEEARLAAIAARFTPSGRTRRGSDLDTRPDPAALTRRGSDSGTQGMEVDPRFQTRLNTARDEARTTPAEVPAPPTEVAAPPAEETSRRSEERTAAETKAEVRTDRLKAVAENADQGKRILDPADALGKGFQAPTAAGLGQEATEMAANAPKTDTGGGSGADVLKHDAAAAGVSGAALSTGAELLALGASVADSFRNLKTALRKRTGAGFHNARRKAKVKAGDAGVSVLSTGANVGTMAKETLKVQGVASTVAATEASGVLSAVAGVAKSVRAVFKTSGAIRKHRDLGKLPDAEAVHAGTINSLKTAWEAEAPRAVEAHNAVLALQAERDQGHPREGWDEALDAAATAYEAAALREAQAKLAYLAAKDDAKTVNETKKFARRKQVSKGIKESVGGGVGEGLKGAGGIATVAIVATVGLASNPAGWITAAVGAGLVVSVAAYKGARSGYGRFQEAHHPERYTPHGEDVPEALPTWESLKHAMKVWKKISAYKRQLAANKLYGMLSRPDTQPELRRSAMDLLVVLKAGPDDHGMDQETWEASLMDPAKKADWIKEITDQLSSGS
ncbi:hypothetical protein [Streptomyces tendae]|uniref:hypothetical protein n=1 Tax=Streptomyces tendae TaxID=1932 RepID=UPI002493C470|nr:hypothetical protein [Streptomyces tendae]